MEQDDSAPSWNRLYEVAAAQEGHFTAAQAAAAGYSPQLLNKYLHNGRITRVRRAIYRIVHFPAGEHEDLTVLWLWSERTGVFCLETALALYELSDVLPASVHMLLPRSWRRRRLQIPRGLVVHHADLEAGERTWCGSVPVTTPARTLRDCAAGNVSPDIVRQALDEGLERGLFTRSEVTAVEAFLARFEEPLR